MDMNSVSLCILVIGLLFDSGHSNYSPCPDVLEFYREGETTYGRITVQPEEMVSTLSTLEIRVSYTIEAELGAYIGDIKAPNDVLFKYNRGEAVQYRLQLPLFTPWPKVTEIAINGKAICTGPGDRPRPNQYLSFPSITQTSFYGTGGGPTPYRMFHHEPQTAVPQPILQAAPRPIPSQTTAQRIPQRERPGFHSLIEDEDFKKVLQSFDIRNDAADFFAFEQQTATTTTERPRTTTPVYVEPVTTERPRTTTPVYVEPVTEKTRPVQRVSNTQTTTADCGLVEGDNIRPLIHNGESYERGEVPWLVAIYKSTKRTVSAICGGTLVSDRHVVTAAHCMYLRTTTAVNDIIVKVGVHELDEWSDTSTVIAKLIAADKHESYNASTLENDIMVLTLDKRLNFTNFIRPACLWTGNTDLSQIVGSSGLVAGWGGINKFNAPSLNEPQMVRVPIVSTKECRASKSIFHQLTSDNTLCAGSRRGDGPCQGDSGGGLYLKDGGRWRLRGVVSISTKPDGDDTSTPCNLNEYVVYTDTAQYLPWIRSILSKNYFD